MTRLSSAGVSISSVTIRGAGGAGGYIKAENLLECSTQIYGNDEVYNASSLTLSLSLFL